MKVLLQKNIWNEYGYERFIQSLLARDVEIREVNLIPFTNKFVDFEFSLSNLAFWPNHIFGSGRFVNVCRDMGYKTFKSFQPIEYFYPADNWINNGEMVRWGDIKITSPRFLKPMTEKFFTGRVVEDQEDLQKVQLATSFIEDENKEWVMVSEPVPIKQEVRFFVIGGQVITGSVYKENGNVKHWRVEPLHDSWKAVVGILGGRFIDDAFVIDIGRVGEYWKIVELNNINSAGIYECDTDALVSALKLL